MSQLGMRPANPSLHSLDRDGVRSVHEVLQRLRNSNQLDDKQLILLVQQDRALDRNYAELKKVFAQHFGAVTQFVRGRNCRARPAIHQKIALQMGCKIGGEAWSIVLPFSVPTMVLGIDCYHSRGKASIAACVATMNVFYEFFRTECGRYYMT